MSEKRRNPTDQKACHSLTGTVILTPVSSDLQIAGPSKRAREIEQLGSTRASTPQQIAAVFLSKYQLRDIVSFLDRQKFVRCRNISRRYNWDLASQPLSVLPRHQRNRFEVITVGRCSCGMA